jgi:hypothetical protein
MKMTPEAQANHLASIGKRKWQDLDPFSQQILTGTTPDPNAALGWATLNNWLDQQRAKLPLGRNLPNGMRAFYEKTIAARDPAFAKDLKFAQQPLAFRLQTFKPVQQSNWPGEWDTLLSTATDRYQQLIHAGYPPSVAAEQWRRNDAPNMRTWLQSQPPGFQTEVARYDGSTKNFIEGLLTP